MYHSLLTNRYLTSRVIPIVAVGAVALCVALVIIVVSIMTGFLDMVRSSGKSLMGDVIVAYPVNGIPHYERLIERIKALPETEAATPVVDGWGLLRMPYPDGERKDTETVQFWGIEAKSFAKVTGYAESLYWKPVTEDMSEADFRHEITPDILEEVLQNGLNLQFNGNKAGIVLGLHISQGNERQKDGSILPALNGYWWMPQFEVTLTIMPTGGGTVIPEPENVKFRVVNEFSSGVFLIDDTRVIIPFDVAQKRLQLHEAEEVDPNDFDEFGIPKVIGINPGRATMILVRATDGIDPKTLKSRVQEVYEAFEQEINADDTAIIKMPPHELSISISTWEEQQAAFIGPIEKERELMRTLFSLVYLVCAGLVLAIFWAIVYEKTRDIGILRSIGASRMGISWIFLRYGLIIGIAGAVVGVGVAYLVVHNINIIHGALGDPPVWLAIIFLVMGVIVIAISAYHGRRGDLLPIALGSLIAITLIGAGVGIIVLKESGGVVIWDPTVYYFTHIPNQMDKLTAIITMVGAVVFSLIGAFLPAAKAADIDPVRALRYE